MGMNDIVEVTCYGKTKTLFRREAIEFYLECMANSEGSERERYTRIYCALSAGFSKVSDVEG